MEKSELSQSQTNANKQDNYTSSKEDTTIRLELENTPYYIVGNRQDGYCITIGKYQISDTFIKNEERYLTLDEITEAAMEYIDLMKWNIIFHTICAIINIKEDYISTKDTIKTN